ncbi:hypothetical protein RFF05_05065 [Bengtsoniella intestinalis]|uniref:hypothetical protein n=1 Tax=Bengtsoniella intestinalis TaxID=3073143 RepID=UPI00391F1BC8
MKLKTRALAQDVLTTIGLIILVLLFLRLWPLLLLAIVCAIVAAVRLLYINLDKYTEPVEEIPPVPVYRSVENEAELRAAAFQILQNRITQQLCECYPDARWVWETHAPINALANGDVLAILLNHAGGYRRATIVVKELQFVTLVFDGLSNPTPCQEHKDEDDDTEDDEEDETPAPTEPEPPTDYSFLAYHWVNDHLTMLNALCNEAISKNEYIVVLTAEQLPEMESWPAICDCLAENELGATVEDGAIHLKLD